MAYSQQGQNLMVWTDLEFDTLLLDRFRAEEAISAPFDFQLDLLSEDPALDERALLRTEMLVSVNGQRYFRGFVRSFGQMGRSGDLTAYRARLVPSLWFLSLSRESRIFRSMSIPEIVTKVLEEQGVSGVSLSCTGTYPPRDFVVQYRETHLDFISRLMEEEGIFYFFQHSQEECKLILADHPGAHKSIEPEEVVDVPVGAEFQVSLGRFYAESIVIDHAVHPQTVTLRDVDTDRSLDPIDGVYDSKRESQEEYDYLGRVTRGESRGEEVARARLEAHEHPGHVISGTTTVPAFEPGRKFNLVGHYRKDFNRGYLLTQVFHDCSAGSYQAGTVGGTGVYQNRFSGIPDDVSYRPLSRAPRPLIHGAHPARVTGPSGDEIHVDAQGRVKVQFFWDREGKLDQNSSCWVPIAQGWAGANRGFLAIPRIGDEVVVEFLEGNPDRPIITASLYNQARSKIPWSLPSEHHKTGIRSLSSKGGRGFNEFSLDDKAGAERIYTHAQKDMVTRVLHDQTSQVDHDQSTTVDNDRTVRVGHDQTTTVENDQRIEVQGNVREIYVPNGEIRETAAELIQVQSENNAIEQKAKTRVLATVDNNKAWLVVKEDGVSQLRGEDWVDIWSDQSITLQGGSAGGKVHVTAGSEIKLEVGGATVTLKMAEIELKMGGSSIKLGPAGVEISGAIVKLNS